MIDVQLLCPNINPDSQDRRSIIGENIVIQHQHQSQPQLSSITMLIIIPISSLIAIPISMLIAIQSQHQCQSRLVFNFNFNANHNSTSISTLIITEHNFNFNVVHDSKLKLMPRIPSIPTFLHRINRVHILSIQLRKNYEINHEINSARPTLN